ncbi:MAG TPA: (5-formylfuran-3-yl)methyl phosphate synthase [Burkholderiaceae bacterium]|nr:(5-formylfuran-3-yl)methyl phosphate synthase [Burkholderiaceae bacterium]
MTRMLVSVRNVAEALAAAAAGADFIDLKEPHAGALGGLALPIVREVVAALREVTAAPLISATIGDWPMAQCDAIIAQVHAVAECGVDYVKVGIENDADAPEVLRALAACGRAVVPVFIADRGVDAYLRTLACALPFPALMLDTADKQAGSLFDCMDDAALRRFVREVRRAGRMVGLAGALRIEHVPQLSRLAPHFAGFRSAVCSGARSSELVPAKVRALRARLHQQIAESVAQVG